MKPRFNVSEFQRPCEAAEIKNVIENQAGRRNFCCGPGWPAGEAIPETGGENHGQDGKYEDITQLLRPRAYGQPEAGDERQDTGVEENVQLEKKGERFTAGETGEKGVLLRRDGAALLPLR